MFKTPLFLKTNTKIITTVSRTMAFISLVLFVVSVSAAPPNLSEEKAVLKPTAVCSHKQKLLKLKKDERRQKMIFKMHKTFLDFFSSLSVNGENKQSKKELLKLLEKQLAPYKIEYNRNPKEFIRQAFYFIAKGKGKGLFSGNGKASDGFMDLGLILLILRGDTFISQEIQIKVISPYLCSADEKIAEDASTWMLGLTYNHKSNSRDLSHFKAYLKKHKNDLPLKLVDFLYSVDSKESLLMMSELLQKNDETKKLLEIINLKDKKDSLDKLSKRSEWWVQLYVLNTIRENKSLRSSELIERLEKTKHLLITKERIDFLKVKIKKRNSHHSAP